MNEGFQNDFGKSFGNDSTFKKLIAGSILSIIFTLIAGVLIYGFIFSVVVLTIYFFLAAAGIVPPVDLIPVIPYV